MLYFSTAAVLLGLPLLGHAYRNVTYNDDDPAIVYRPARAWVDWPPAGCLSWPGGQYTTNPAGSITLNFYGVAVYAYGLFDDSSNPIYTIQVDNSSPVELGRGTNANPQSCAPIYSKTDLKADNHTIVFKMTSTRPDDVKDLSFQGFIVTIPEDGDVASTDTTKKPPFLIIGASAGGVAVVIIAIVVFFVCRARRNRASKVGSQPMSGSAVPLVVSGYGQPMQDPSIPAPTPYILPPSREASPYYPPVSAPWPPVNNSENQSYYNGSNQGALQTPSHVTYGSSTGYSTPPPSNDGYSRPYGSPGTPPVNSNQQFYQNPANPPGMSGASQQHHQYVPDQGQYQMQGYQQPPHAWNSPTSPPPQTEVSYMSRDEASSSVSRPTTTEPHQSSIRYTKGAVDHHAAPVVRNENADLQKLGPKRESQGGDAPPPEYGAY